MVRASKTVVEKTVAPPVVVDETVAPVKKTKKSKVVEPVKSAVEMTQPVELTQPVVEQIPVNEVVSSEVAPAAAELPTLQLRLTEFAAKLQQISLLFNSTKTEYKLLEKLIAKSEKLALKNSHRKKKTSGNRAPSGFVKPTLITDELATFLGKSHGTKMARTEVSKEINRYIREQQLQDKSNGRKIIPDNKLTALLKLKDSDELTYFNLQRFMKHHFIKDTPLVA